MQLVGGAGTQETIAFWRGALLAGVEVLEAADTERRWRWFNTEYSMAFPTSWRGEVRYRGRSMAAGPGSVFCSAPGEIHTTPRVEGPGTFYVLLFDPNL